jgi:hypothetical protein
VVEPDAPGEPEPLASLPEPVHGDVREGAEQVDPELDGCRRRRAAV